METKSTGEDPHDGRAWTGWILGGLYGKKTAESRGIPGLGRCCKIEGRGDTGHAKNYGSRLPQIILGSRPMMVTLGMRNNVLPIGFAIKKEDRYSESWSYNH